MTSLVAKYISKKVLGETVKNNFGTEDPYFETVPATRLNGKPHETKTKQRRKALPPGISEHDGKVLTKVKRRAYRLDCGFGSCCGVKFGYGSIIGLIPGIGDVIDAFMALMVLRTCQQVEGGLPNTVKSKMMLNIIIDFCVGLVPFLGDLADAVFRANTRNAVELEKFLRAKGEANLKAAGTRLDTVVDPSSTDEYDRLIRAEHGAPPGYSTTTGADQHVVGSTQSGGQSVDNRVPVQPNAGNAVNAGSGGGFFGFGKKAQSTRQDEERGRV